MSIYSTYLMIKQAAFDLPDLEVNPRNKMTRLMKGLKWGVKVNGKSESPDETTFIFNLDPKTKYEVIGDDSSDVASCVDLTNRVVKNMKGIGSLATLTSNGGVPHLTPLFKHKGKYYLIHGEHQYSNPYDTLDAVGDRWYTDPSVPVPEYVDFYDLPADETITEKDLRKVIDEVKRKAKKTYRKYYTDRPGYKKANVSDKQRLDEARKFVEAVRRMALKRKLNFFLVTDGASGIRNNGNPAVRNAREAQIKWELENGSDPYEDWGTKQASKNITFPSEEINNLKGKDHLYTTRVSSDYDKYNLGDTVTTPWGDNYVIDSEDIYDDVKKHKFYDELTDEQKKLLSQYKVMKLLGLTKKASRLYTYVDPDADLSQGLLSLRNAPEFAIINKYKNRVQDPANLNKEFILNHIAELDPSRPDWIYAFDAPIPDKANDGLIRFRDTHKLVSWDPEQVKDLIKILRRYHNPKTREEVSADFTPLKYMRWDRDKDGMSMRHAPVYKILTESGRIPAELLREE